MGCQAAQPHQAAGGTGWDILGAALEGLHFAGPIWSF
jgi:hypothetical protein